MEGPGYPGHPTVMLGEAVGELFENLVKQATNMVHKKEEFVID